MDTKPHQAPENDGVSYPRSTNSLLVESFQGLVIHALVVSFGNEEIAFGIWDGQVLAGATIGIDTETSPIEGHSIPRLILASASDTRRHVVIPRERLLDFIRTHSERTFVAHNATFDSEVRSHWHRSPATACTWPPTGSARPSRKSLAGKRVEEGT